MPKYKIQKLPDKWVTPAALQKILDEKGEHVPLSTISTWITNGEIPALELPGAMQKRYLVDKTKVPERRKRGRQFGFKVTPIK